jgi:predicted membrane protein
MGFIFSGIFWGIILILLGLSVILNIVFNIHLPFFRILFSLIIIYFGLRLLVGGAWCSHAKNSAICQKADITVNQTDNEYKVIFGRATFNTSDTLNSEMKRNISVKTIFGEGTIIISSTVPTIVRVTSAFGSATFPDGNTITFGEYTYRNKACGSDLTNCKRINAEVVFGSMKIIEE